MSGITTGVGPFSGINSAQLIDQLMSLASQPKVKIQARVTQLKSQQAGILDINTRLNSLQTAAAKFTSGKIFQANTVNISDTNVLAATATNSAAAGTYQFTVDRLVSSQQLLSRGFGDSRTVAVGAGNFTIESDKARVDRDVALANLNGGNGVSRGKISITAGGQTATIDLSKAQYVSDVLDAINSNGTVGVTARAVDDKIVLTAAGGGTVTVANVGDTNTATSLGIAGSGTGTITGSGLLSLTANTALSTLNDGNGVDIKSVFGTGGSNFDVKVTRGGVTTNVAVNIGEVYQTTGTPPNQTTSVVQGPASTVGDVLKRINDSLAAAGFSNVQASIAPDGNRLRIAGASGDRVVVSDKSTGTTAKDLGLVGDSGALNATLTGTRIKSGINTSLLKTLNGGKGVGDGQLSFATADGTNFNVSIRPDSTLADAIADIEAASDVGAGKTVRVELNKNGTGLIVTDLTAAGGSNPFLITGTIGPDANNAAKALGIETPALGASGTVIGTNLQRQYITRSTLVSSLNNGKGLGTGQFRITDSTGQAQTVDIGSDTKNLGDLIDEINTRGLKIKASINSTGDGILITEDLTSGPAGGTKIKIEDLSGSVAKSLNLASEASGTGAANTINGSFEKTVTISGSDTLQQIADKVNAAGAGVSASIIRDGVGATPFRLSLSSTNSGRSGRFIIDTGSFDLGLSTLDKGQDALAFFGATDPAKAIAFSSSTNTLDSAISGVSIDLKNTSSSPVTLSVTRDTAGIESAIDTFVKAFNDVIGRIKTQTRYDEDTGAKGALLGDGTMIDLRSRLYSTLQSAPQGITSRYSNLTQIGFSIGTSGTVSFDREKFREAMAEDPESVEALLAAKEANTPSAQQDIPGVPGVKVRSTSTNQTFSKLGVISAFEELAKSYITSGTGVLERKRTSLDDVIKTQNDRIAALDIRLESKRQVLSAQFLRMEQAIGQLQSQQSSLASLSSSAG